MTDLADHAVPVPDWDTTLEALELSLLAWERWLGDTSDEPPEQWSPPTGLAPLPPEQGSRARGLHARYEAVTALAAVRLDAVRRQREAVVAPRGSRGGYGGQPGAAYLDLQA